MESVRRIKQNLINGILKYYMSINIIILGLLIYILLFPIISIPIKNIIPAFGLCPYLQITGKPCPLCGGTRYFSNIFEVFHNINYLWSPFGIIAIVIALQVVFRIKNIIKIKKEKDCQKTVKIDILVTLTTIITFFLYEVIYFIIN